MGLSGRARPARTDATDSLVVLAPGLRRALPSGCWVCLDRIGSALPSTGAGLELRAIGAVVIGGVPITGGKGGIVGTFFGVLLLGVISNMLNILRINPFLQEIAFGALIVLAIAISWLRTRVSGDR